MARRVWITGIGAVTGLGVGIGPLWKGLCAGRTAIGPLTRVDPDASCCKFGSEVRDFSAKDFVPKGYRKAVKVMVRDTELAVAAAKCAADDAGLITKANLGEGEESAAGVTTYPPERLGCHIGAGLIVSDTQEVAGAMVTARAANPSAQLLEQSNGLTLKGWGSIPPEGGHGMDNLQPLWMLKYLPNMLACHVTIIHGAEGPSNTITCAEASGLLSIGESCRVIERGDADVCFSGGAESKITLLGIVRMDLAGRLGQYAGVDSVRPYDPEAEGTLPGEAGALLVLEERESAVRRGARGYAEVAGYGAAHSAPPSIPPLLPSDVHESNEGLELAIRAAMKDAGLGPDEIDAIVPQACGIPSVDQPEAGALRTVFGHRLAQIPLIAIAPYVGDCAAGNGGLLAAVAAMCIREQFLPGTTSLGGAATNLIIEKRPAGPTHLNNILVCSSSMGGQNAALVIRTIKNGLPRT